MGIEIERKFLVVGRAWRRGKATRYRQGYLSVEKGRVVRVRTAGRKGYLTVKGPTRGAERPEYEYKIPFKDARELLGLCHKPLIDKVRYRVRFGGVVWDVDEFWGENRGLVVAELELPRPNQKFARPSWLGREVTDDPRYSNAALVARPFGSWGRP